MKPVAVPRTIHACILLGASGLAVLVTAVLGPSLMKMQQHFSALPDADYLVPLSLTVPMSVMALGSVFAGALSDHIGRKFLLVSATAVYAVIGTAPMWLNSLSAILVSRILIGVCEAIIMPLSTTMIGDYFSGSQREKLMALQTTLAAGCAIFFNMVGGYVGEYGWRAPYAVYLISLILTPLMVIYLWEPIHSGKDQKTMPTTADDVQTLNLGLLIMICGIAILGGLTFLVVPVHLAYVMNAIGVESSGMIGGAAALNSVAVMVGTLLFGWIVAPRMSVALQLALSVALAGIGYILMGWATSYQGLVAAVIVNGLGCGMLLPTMVTWNMRILPFARRGFGIGLFQSGLYFGMFVNPILIVFLAKVIGRWSTLLETMGLALMAFAGLAILVRMRKTAQVHAHQ